MNFAKLGLLVIAIIVTCFGSSHALAQVNYPVISQSLRSQLDAIVTNAATADKFIGSEYMYHNEGDFIAITLPTIAGGALFSVAFEDIDGFPQLKEAVLTLYGTNEKIRATDALGYWDYPDGTHETYGKTTYRGQVIYMYSQSVWTPDHNSQYWQFVATWGEGADILQFGKVIDRTHFGTIPGEERMYGYWIVKIAFDGQKPVIGVAYDADAMFKLQASSGGLNNWMDRQSQVTEIPDGEMTSYGITFKGILVHPDEGESLPTMEFFRLVVIE